MAISAPSATPASTSAIPAVSGRRFDKRRPEPTGRRRILTQLTPPWFFLAAALGLLLLLTYWPAVNLIYYSFTSWDGSIRTRRSSAWTTTSRCSRTPPTSSGCFS